MRTHVEEVTQPQGDFGDTAGARAPRVFTGAELGEKSSAGWPEWSTVLLYAAVVAYAISCHEPWADEAQAWPLARSLSIPSLLLDHIRYEGSPGLWYLLLWLLNRAHISYSGMHWICGGIAVASTSLLVLRSPFP